jgi:putative ABC transport system permease protein
MTLLLLAWKSLRNRWFTVMLCVLTIALSTCILLGVEHIRSSAKKSFQSTVSGTDLIVGARTGAVPLLLYTVFHIGEATNNISYASYRRISESAQVAWSIPIQLGDSYMGYRVVGTSDAMFQHYRYGAKHALTFQQGKTFSNAIDQAVVGAEVAQRLRLKLGDALSVAHGTGNVGILKHDHAQQKLVGILAPTGTPIDQSVFVSLAAIEHMHAGFDGSARRQIQANAPMQRDHAPNQAHKSLQLDSDHHAHDHQSDHGAAEGHHHEEHKHDHQSTSNALHKLNSAATPLDTAAANASKPKAITAFFLGLKSRPMALALQRQINTDAAEPMLAILPTPTLQQLWRLMSVAERALALIASAVVLTGLIGMMMTLMATLEQRRREMAILRAVGAKSWHVFALLMLESSWLCAAGLLFGALLMTILTLSVAPLMATHGIYLDTVWISPSTILLLIVIFVASLVLALVPALLAWRRSLVDGLSIRI